MATMPGKNSNGSSANDSTEEHILEAASAAASSRPARTVLSNTRPARAARAVSDAVTMAEDEFDSLTAAGLPERKYSFNALVAVGLAGFVLGKIFGR